VNDAHDNAADDKAMLDRYMPADDLMRLADGTIVTPQLYVQDGRTLYKISTPDHRPRKGHPGATAQVCMENGKPPARTSVRWLGKGLLHQMSPATDRIVDQYHALLDHR
jgi:hypothetical protein